MSDLNTKQREALRLLAERTDERSPDPGMICSDSTFADRYNVWINWRTAQALHRKGLVTYPYIGSGFDGDLTSIAITDAGRAALKPAERVQGEAGEGASHTDRGETLT